MIRTDAENRMLEASELQNAQKVPKVQNVQEFKGSNLLGSQDEASSSLLRQDIRTLCIKVIAIAD